MGADSGEQACEALGWSQHGLVTGGAHWREGNMRKKLVSGAISSQKSRSSSRQVEVPLQSSPVHTDKLRIELQRGELWLF